MGMAIGFPLVILGSFLGTMRAKPAPTPEPLAGKAAPS
jgi:hypothetical protein